MTDIERQLQDWLKNEGVAVLNEEQGAEFLEKEADKFIEILNKYTANLPFSFEITKGRPSIIDNQGYIPIYFNHDDAHRESWYSEEYPNGADLILLFNNGYDAKDYVYDKTRTVMIDGNESHPRSLTHRDPLSFIQNAIAEYNMINDKVQAEYDTDIYTPVL